MTTTFKDIIFKYLKQEDAPTNAVGDGGNVALPPKHEPGVKKKKKLASKSGTSSLQTGVNTTTGSSQSGVSYSA